MNNNPLSDIRCLSTHFYTFIDRKNQFVVENAFRFACDEVLYNEYRYTYLYNLHFQVLKGYFSYNKLLIPIHFAKSSFYWVLFVIDFNSTTICVLDSATCVTKKQKQQVYKVLNMCYLLI